ncbi:hypothetical protein HanHA300_Chr04g0138581 [Helianthus annuus]|nr:hypothetical protein HanHA300_Chr04g0138581 [Helianthus annuus]KAJ0597181.1 hypothetical protein HanHA89_Chr04g0151541 [Helianthus annuus]KAJ0757861.1 hypothetical protein HanLR1_Chr04g0143621 [Helianthus annuus]KAJ0761529.1 hypothetical protein HanOQP8_Chr04g0150871 [Helianthus annuus]
MHLYLRIWMRLNLLFSCFLHPSMAILSLRAQLNVTLLLFAPEKIKDQHKR